MSLIDLLHQRNSAPKLCEPGPDAAVMERLFMAAMRAPDHARLKPWRFLLVEGDAREALGELYAEAAALRDPAADVEKAKAHPLRAPVLVVVIARLQAHPKVPEIEQMLSAGCAAHGLLLAAEAEGFAGVWRTGDHAFDPHVAKGLGLEANERIVGFIYLGSRNGPAKPLPNYSTDDFVSSWEGA